MIDEAMRQVPALTIMFGMMLAFLRHLATVNARHDQVLREATEAILRCAEALGENANVLRENLLVLRRMNGERKEG